MNLAKIENGIIVNIAVFNPDNIPNEFSDWIDATDLMIGMIDDGAGNFIEPTIPDLTSEELLELKNVNYKNIDTIAEKTRLRYVTEGSAQAMTYQLKGDEAITYIAAGYPVDLTSYSFIQAEVNATGKTSTQAADDIIVQRNAWIVIGASIEEVRISGKKAVYDAIDTEGVNTAYSTAKTALDAI